MIMQIILLFMQAKNAQIYLHKTIVCRNVGEDANIGAKNAQIYRYKMFVSKHVGEDANIGRKYLDTRSLFAACWARQHGRKIYLR